MLWQNCDAGYEWYIGYVKNITAEGHCVHHLHQVNEDCHNKWKYPSQQDVHTAEFGQIVNCVVHVEQDIRKRFFTVKNIKDNIIAFNNHVK